MGQAGERAGPGQVAFPGPLQPPSQEPCDFVTHMIHLSAGVTHPCAGGREGGVVEALGDKPNPPSPRLPPRASLGTWGWISQTFCPFLYWVGLLPLPSPGPAGSAPWADTPRLFHTAGCRPCGSLLPTAWTPTCPPAHLRERGGPNRNQDALEEGHWAELQGAGGTLD